MDYVNMSVIVSIYNKRDYLEKCINSILNSTLKSIEVICIDDCSNDGSRELLHSIGKTDSRIVILQNEINYGVAYARNRGVSKANGKYIAFVDADDYLEPDALEKYFKFMEHNSAEMCFIKFLIENGVAESGIVHSYSDIYEGLKLLDKFVDNNDFFLYACGVIYQRSFLQNNKLLFSDLKTGEGGLFVLEALLLAKRVIVSDYKGYHYYINETSVNKSKNAMQSAIVGQIYQLIFMEKKFMENENSHEIKHFLEWYIRKNIGGIINLTLENEKTVKDNLPSEYDRFIFELLKGEYLSKNIELTDNERQIILDKKKLYLYGAGYETLNAIKLCNELGIEILGIFVTSTSNNMSVMYGYRIQEFNVARIKDFTVPFMITAHKKHQREIEEKLKNNGIKEIICI